MKKVILTLMLLPSFLSGQVKNDIDPGPGQVVITEIMADPSPPVALPEEEYLEIFNASETVINLAGWTLNFDGRSLVFPQFELKSGEYLILCSVTDTAFFSGYGKVLGLKSYPPLNDTGRWLTICDPRGVLIHGTDYKPYWYGSELKSGGGWSLEMIDPCHAPTIRAREFAWQPGRNLPPGGRSSAAG